jgi:hypothetical protein
LLNSKQIRPDYFQDFVETTVPMTTTTEPDVGMNKQQKQLNPGCPSDRCAGTCDASDYKDTCVPSWRTNCPDGCAITKYVKDLDHDLDASWNKVVTQIQQSMHKSGQIGGNIHVTLDEIIKKIKDILKNIKKEKDQFLAIKRTYDSANIDGILAQQRLSWTQLEQKRAELQIALSNKQKKFREEANFCKVSFREYDEEVCDITRYVQKY